QDLLERADGRTSPGGNDRGRTHGVLSSESLRSGAGIAWCSPTDQDGRTIGDLEEHLLQGCAANLKVAQDRVVLGGPGKKYRDHAVSTLVDICALDRVGRRHYPGMGLHRHVRALHVGQIDRSEERHVGKESRWRRGWRAPATRESD